MKRVIFGIIVVLTVFAMISCDNGTTTAKKSNAAALTSLKFGDATITVPTAIASATWDGLTDLSTATATDYEIIKAATVALTQAASAKATVEVATGATKAGLTFAAAGATIALTPGNYVVFKVTAEDKKVINYYVIALKAAGTNTTLSSIKVATGADSAYTTGSRADTIAGITTFAEVGLSDAEKTNAEVTLNFGAQFHGTAKVIKVLSTAAAPTEADFQNVTNYSATDKPKFTFADEDKIYVQMLAEDEATLYYYAWKVLIGWDTSLLEDTGVVFINTYMVPPKAPATEEVEVTETFPADRFGTPLATVAALDALPLQSDDLGKIQFSITQPATGFAVVATPNDPQATASISQDGSDWETIGNGDKIIIPDTGNPALYVKVVSSNGKATKFYKILLILKQSVKIPYGTPASVDANAPDAVWATGATDWLYINRYNVTEGTGLLEMEPEDRSYGRAKLMWDVDGMWIYAQIWEQNISEDPGVGSNAHMASSVELFINEGTATTGNVTSAGTNGGQYRLGANGETSGSPTDPAVSAFQALNKNSAKKWTNNDFPYATATDPIKNGYVVIFQAPWLFPNLYKLEDHKKLTIELQINATNYDGTRAGVINWNNVSSNSYGSLADYGDASLELNGKTMAAQKPSITAQPSGGGLILDTNTPVTLTVTAVSNDEGALSYAWYKTADPSAAGTAVATGGTSATLSVSDFTATAYYYVNVTNTKNGDSKTVKSGLVGLIVYAPEPDLPDDWIEKVTMAGGACGPVYGFYIGNETFDQYTKIKFDIKWIGSAAANRRTRIWGNYNYASWSNVNSRPDMGNATPGGLLIGSSDGGTNVPITWTSWERAFNNRDAVNTSAAIKASKGIILLCLSPVAEPGGSSGGSYYIKNIVLVKTDNTEVKVMHPNSKLLWGGNGAGAYVGGAAVTRTILAAGSTESDD